MQSNLPNFSFRQWPFLWPLVGLIFGIILQETFRPGRDFWLAFFTLGLLGCLLSQRFCNRQAYLLRTMGVCLPFLFAGGLLRAYEDHRYAPEWYGNHLEESSALLVEITGRPEVKPATLFLPVRVTGYHKNRQWEPALGKLNLYLYKNANLSTYENGDRLLIPAAPVPLTRQGGPYGFDYAGYMALNNTFYQCFLSSEEVLHLPRTGKPDRTGQLQQGILNCLERTIRDEPTRALAAAILLNHRADLEDRLLQAYSTTGITHIIAISGMHVSLLFGLFLILLKWIRHKKHEWIKYLLAIPLVWGYILLTGYPPSAVRAGIMFSFLALGIALGKPANPINLLAATAFVLLCFKPAWLYDVGVQLSFLAVLSILIFYKPISALVSSSNMVLKYLWNSVAVCLAAQILVFPLVIYYFHQFPVWVIPANVPATFFSLLLMVGTLVILILDLFGLPAAWLGYLLSLMTQGFHELIYFFSGHAPAFSSRLYLSSADFWMLTLAVVAVSAFIGHRRSVYGYAGLCLIALLISGQFIRDFFAHRQEQLVVYPIGRQSFTDYFKGKQVWSVGIASDSVAEKAFRYTVFPNRLGQRAVKTGGHLAAQEAFVVHGKRILYLRESPRLPDNPDVFNVDVLILSSHSVVQARSKLSCFQPKTIVLDASFPAWKAKKWAAIFRSHHISVHSVSEQGAWHFPGPG